MKFLITQVLDVDGVLTKEEDDLHQIIVRMDDGNLIMIELFRNSTGDLQLDICPGWDDGINVIIEQANRRVYLS